MLTWSSGLDKIENDRGVRMSFEFVPMTMADIGTFKKEIQEAFQKGFEVKLYPCFVGVVVYPRDLNLPGLILLQHLIAGSLR